METSAVFLPTHVPSLVQVNKNLQVAQKDQSRVLRTRRGLVAEL